MVGVVGRVVLLALDVVHEALGDEHLVRHPGDGLEAGVLRQPGHARRQVPLLGRGQHRARGRDVVAQDRGAAGVAVDPVVVALGGDEDAVRVARERHALGVRHAGAVGVDELLAVGPAVGRVRLPLRAVPDQAEERRRVVAHGPQDAGRARAGRLIRQAAEVRAEHAGVVGDRHRVAAEPGLRGPWAFVRGAARGAVGPGHGARAVGAAAEGGGRVPRPRVAVDQRDAAGA